MSEIAVCLAEFLLFLGIPYLKALKSLITSAITQLKVEKGELLASLSLNDTAQAKVQAALGVAALAADQVRNTLGSLPMGTFRDCAEVANMLGVIRGAFDSVLSFYDVAANEANRITSFSNIKGALSSQIDEEIAYLEELNSQIDIAIANLVRKGASQL